MPVLRAGVRMPRRAREPPVRRPARDPKAGTDGRRGPNCLTAARSQWLEEEGGQGARGVWIEDRLAPFAATSGADPISALKRDDLVSPLMVLVVGNVRAAQRQGLGWSWTRRRGSINEMLGVDPTSELTLALDQLGYALSAVLAVGLGPGEQPQCGAGLLRQVRSVLDEALDRLQALAVGDHRLDHLQGELPIRFFLTPWVRASRCPGGSALQAGGPYGSHPRRFNA